MQETILSILSDYPESTNFKTLDVTELYIIFRDIANHRSIFNDSLFDMYLSFVREPTNFEDETFIDAQISFDTKQAGTIYIHIEEIQWLNSETKSEAVTEIIEIINRINKKIQYLESIFAHV